MSELWTANFLEPDESITPEEYQGFITLAVDTIEGFIRRELGTEQLVQGEIKDEEAQNIGEWYYPKVYPVVSISSITLNDESIDPNDIEIYYGAIRRPVNKYFPTVAGGLTGKIKMTYTAGFGPDVVNQLKMIVIQYVHFAFQNLKAGRFGQTSRTYQDGTATWKTEQEYLEEVRKQIRPLRRVVI
ncbi:MAG TPA: hypothetical protein PLL62_09230 [Candidatus Saccharicenans sp.]|jgi:hypothetical protein|nr:hypothetical protein [Candidatus Saccharicenans sp.]